MRNIRQFLAAALVTCLVVASAPMTASAMTVRPATLRGATVVRISPPHVATSTVTAGQAFDAVGSVLPTIAPDDTATAIAVRAYSVGARARETLVGSFDATPTGPVGRGTGYDASVTLPAAGRYLLVGVVVRSGKVVARSAVQPVRAVLPYALGSPRVASVRVPIGQSFDATGAILPALAPGDTSSAVTLQLYKIGVKGGASLVATIDASIADTGDAYSATLSLPSGGAYELIAVLTSSGTTVGRSGVRTLVATPLYKVSAPRVARAAVTVGSAFDATGVVSPAIADDDTATVVSVHLYRVGAKGGRVLVSGVAAALTGPVAAGVGYDASLTVTRAGHYALIAVVTRDGVVLGASAMRSIVVRR